MEIWATMRQGQDGVWTARVEQHEHLVASGDTREECVRALRRLLDERFGLDAGVTLVVEVVPVLAGVAEVAEVMGWDKRRVITYIDRGRFPEPIQSLASGRVWARRTVEQFAAEWRSRQTLRRERRAGGAYEGGSTRARAGGTTSSGEQVSEQSSGGTAPS